MKRRPIRSLLVITAAAALNFCFVAQGESESQRSALTAVGPDGFADNSESLQSILLLYLARNITPSKATELETEVRSHPDAIEPRLSLIGYYTWRCHNIAERSRLREYVLWMVANHPEHPSTGEPALRDLPDDPEGNIQILDLWTTNLRRRADEYSVLRNAEKFFFSKDPAEAEQIIYRLHEQDPQNREWPQELAELYTMSGVPHATTDAGRSATEAYRRVLSLTNDSRLRSSLAGDMAGKFFKAGNLAGAAALAAIFAHSLDRNAIQRANTLLGRIALRSGDIVAARRYLLDSTNCRSFSDVPLSSPMMTLAQELLDKGERDVVVQYLNDCLDLWPQHADLLQLWIGEIEHGGTPDFGSGTL